MTRLNSQQLIASTPIHDFQSFCKQIFTFQCSKLRWVLLKYPGPLWLENIVLPRQSGVGLHLLGYVRQKPILLAAWMRCPDLVRVLWNQKCDYYYLILYTSKLHLNKIHAHIKGKSCSNSPNSTCWMNHNHPIPVTPWVTPHPSINRKIQDAMAHQMPRTWPS